MDGRTRSTPDTTSHFEVRGTQAPGGHGIRHRPRHRRQRPPPLPTSPGEKRRCQAFEGRRCGSNAPRQTRSAFHPAAPSTVPATSIQVLQANIGSILSCLDELRLRLDETRPDIVLIQEAQLHEASAIKFPGYHPIIRQCQTPRSGDAPCGGGLLTLICSDRLDLSFSVLPEYSLSTDTTTELQHLRLHIATFSGHQAVDITKVFIPSIHGSADNHQTQLFDSECTFARAIAAAQEDPACVRLLIAGNFNAHAPEWDIGSIGDRRGEDLADFLLFGEDRNYFEVLNDGLGTYHTSTCDTAPDVSFLCGGKRAHHWHRLPPLGGCHHDAITYCIDVTPDATPLQHLPRWEAKKTGISWQKVE